MDREYTYSLDGSSMGWATNCADDEDRTFLYDGANRLVCATDEASSSTCPSGTSFTAASTWFSSQLQT